MSSDKIIFLLSISCLCSARDVYIQPAEGEHSPGTPCYNINDLGRLADNFSNSSGFVVHFLEGTHLLDLQELVVFTNLTNALFEGDGRMEQGFHETVWQSTVVIKCSSSTGIAFVNSSNITFRFITITNCGADMTSFCQTKAVCSSSLGFFKIDHNIAVDHVSIQNGTGNGLLIETDGVDLIITDSSFAQNYIYGDVNARFDIYAGSNVAIFYIDPLSCDSRSHAYNSHVLSTNVSFTDSEFKRMEGISVVMLQRSYKVNILLDSIRAYGNKGFGNIYIAAVEHDVSTFNVVFNNSLIFGGNTTGYPFIVTSVQPLCKQCPVSKDALLNSSIAIVNSKFVYNINSKGAVVSISATGVTFIKRTIIRSTEFSHNIGFVVDLKLFSYQYLTQFYGTFDNVIAYNNSWPYYDDEPVVTVIYAVCVTSLVLNNVNITSNNLTGLFAYHTTIVVNGTSVFHNNTGIDRGGLALYENSYLVFLENSTLYFTNNKARSRGGAIFVDPQRELGPCFFQYSNQSLIHSINVKMSGNEADTAGTVLFGSNIVKCYLFLRNLTFGFESFKKIFDYSAQTGLSVISSEPTDVCFCDDNNTINCSQTQLTMTAYPGEKINISFLTVGQLNGIAPGVILIRPFENKRSGFGSGLKVLTTPMNCTNLVFEPVHNAYALSVLDSKSYKVLKISSIDCPLGFEVSNRSRSCSCEELKDASTAVTCDSTTNTISRKGDIWIGNIGDCVVVQSPCPFDYCNIAQANFSLINSDAQCALNRTGLLCGRCQNGLSLALGSNNCIQCPQFSYLALIIPFAAAGFGLVALLMVLNLTVSIGTINGLIFYANLVKISESTGIFFPNGPIPVLSQFISWLNLDFGIETCFYHGMTAYAKMWLQFVFPLYIWFIIATIIVLCRYSTWLSNKIGGNVVQVLATLILLSFTKIFRTVVLVVKFITLTCANKAVINELVWYMDGNVRYLSQWHAVLLAAAVLFLLLAAPYTLALLFDPVIEKYLTKSKFFADRWIKFKPLVDAYHGPYKDNCRFWTGLLLLIRMSFTSISFHLDVLGTLIFITTSTIMLLSLMVIFEGVYQKRYINNLECLSYFNLGLLSALAAVYQNNEHQKQLVTIISVSIALVSFGGIVLFHVLLRLSHTKYFNKIFSKRFACCGSREESMSLLGSMAEQHVQQPTVSEVCLKRESLIYSQIDN